MTDPPEKDIVIEPPQTAAALADRRYAMSAISGCSPVGRAPHLGCGSRAFESRHSDQKSVKIDDFDGFFIFKNALERAAALARCSSASFCLSGVILGGKIK